MSGALSAQMHAAAETLAAQVEGGAYDPLSVQQRFELRWLALGIEAWSDRVATLEGELTTATGIRRPCLVRRIIRRVFA